MVLLEAGDLRLRGFGAQRRLVQLGLPREARGARAAHASGERPRAAPARMRNAVEEVGRVAAAEGIDAQYFRSGQLASPIGASQLPGV